MRSELEALKQKVLEELKLKSAELEQEADDLENERVKLDKLLSDKETEFAQHIQEVSDAHDKHLRDVIQDHERHLKAVEETQAKQLEML